MAVDYRLDPFENVLNTVNISGETHTIPSVSPYTIRLAEVPLKETPSSISLTIGGLAAEEVSSAPAKGQFWPDYSTGADGDDDWNTGTILFNAADAGKTVVVAYRGTGGLVDEVLGTHVFIESGSVTAPLRARYAIISGCGGGGGGAGGYNDSTIGNSGGAGGHCINYPIAVTPSVTYSITVGAGGARGAWGLSGQLGGATSFGALLSLGGGGGGNFLTGGAPGANGSSVVSAGYNGSSGLFGTGGARRTSVGHGNPPSGFGAGGGGAYGNTSNGAAGAPGILIIKWVA